MNQWTKIAIGMCFDFDVWLENTVVHLHVAQSNAIC